MIMPLFWRYRLLIRRFWVLPGYRCFALPGAESGAAPVWPLAELAA